MLFLKIEIEGKSRHDLELALQEVLSQVTNGLAAGRDSNDSGKYTFDVVGDEEDADEMPDWMSGEEEPDIDDDSYSEWVTDIDGNERFNS